MNPTLHPNDYARTEADREADASIERLRTYRIKRALGTIERRKGSRCLNL